MGALSGHPIRVQPLAPRPLRGWAWLTCALALGACLPRDDLSTHSERWGSSGAGGSVAGANDGGDEVDVGRDAGGEGEDAGPAGSPSDEADASADAGSTVRDAGPDANLGAADAATDAADSGS